MSTISNCSDGLRTEARSDITPIPKPKKKERPGEIRKRHLKREWERARDQFKRNLQNTNGTWTCEHCWGVIPTWEEAIVHHKKTKGSRPDLRLERDNFAILHHHCHLAIHTGHNVKR